MDKKKKERKNLKIILEDIMKNGKKTIIILMFIIFSLKIFSFENKLTIEGYGTISGKKENISHWMYSGKEGVFNKFDEKAGIFINYNGEFNKIDYGLKIKISNSNNEDNIEIKEVYLGKKWENYLVFAGKKNYKKANEKSDLSTGSLLVSENSESPLRIHFGTNGYTPVWKTKGKLLLSASMSNSVLESDRKCKSPYIHEKEAYLKLKTGDKSALYGGISHAALWGGELNGEKINSDFMDFISVLIVDNKGDNGIENEVVNKIGDHKGIYEIGYENEVFNKKINFYYQHFFEDRDGKKFNNWRDMVLGTQIKNKQKDIVEEVVAEYLYTKHQGGTGNHLETGGQDYYYDNYLYGPWTYDDMIIGNSLFITEGSGENIKIVHSRIKAFHLGVKGSFTNEIRYKTMVTYSENFGTCADVGKDIFTNGKKQWYTYFEIEKNNLFKYKNLSGKMGIGYDDGEIFNRTGVITSLKYSFK
jgi:hypothetical protein